MANNTMDEYKNLLKVIDAKTGASPILAKCLLSIGAISEVNLNSLISKVSNNNIDKLFSILKAINSDGDLYFSIIENIKENKDWLVEISEMKNL